MDANAIFCRLFLSSFFFEGSEAELSVELVAEPLVTISLSLQASSEYPLVDISNASYGESNNRSE